LYGSGDPEALETDFHALADCRRLGRLAAQARGRHIRDGNAAPALARAKLGDQSHLPPGFTKEKHRLKTSSISSPNGKYSGCCINPDYSPEELFGIDGRSLTY
jgi:hypothetical protein